MVRSVVGAWLALNVTVLVLYTVVPSLWLNDGYLEIAGMPALLLWFTVLPVVIPGVMALFYLWDRRMMARFRPGASRADAGPDAGADGGVR